MIWTKVKSLFPKYRRAQERDMQEEMAALEEIAGRKELGNLTQAAENARAVWGWQAVENLAADIRHAVRILRKQRSFTAVAVISLALAIGANAAIFRIMDALLWRDLPAREPDQLVRLGENSRSYFVYSRLAEGAAPVMEAVAGAFNAAPLLDTGGGIQRGAVTYVTGNYFETLGVSATLGRAITPEDDRRANPASVALLSYGFWQQAYGRDPSVVGKAIHVGQASYTIIGVTPAEFFGLTVEAVPDLWIPMSASHGAFEGVNWMDRPNYNVLTVFGRLRPDIGMPEATTVLAPVIKQYEPGRIGPVELTPMTKGISRLRNRFSKPLQTVFAMVAIGMLLACVNVMSLQFARWDERQRELNVRLAMGAGRARVLRQLLTESVLVALGGGLLGLALYGPICTALISILASNEPIRLLLGPDFRLALFLVGVSLAAALISGLLPALRATRGSIQPALQRSSRAATPDRLRRGLGRTVASAQLALSLFLVAGSCLFIFSLHQLRHFDAGLNRERLLVVDLSKRIYTREAVAAMRAHLEERLAAVPGVEAVAFSQNGLYVGRNADYRVEVDGPNPASRQARGDVVGPQYFSIIGARILAGREFTESDRTDPYVTVVNEAFAQHFFPDANPVGRNMYLAIGKSPLAFRVIGVVQNIRGENVRSKPRPWFYSNFFQSQVGAFATAFLVRTKTDPSGVIAGLREAARLEDSALNIDINSAEELLDRTLDTDRLIAALAWGFGVLAIMLAGVGVYGLFSYDVTRRTGEIGIRVALGATKHDIHRLILRESALLCAAGLAVGWAAAWSVARLAEGLVFGVTPQDPRIGAVASVLLAGVALAAAWIPARRAARMDPMVALRAE